ncbi:DNA primase small subunit [Neonectria ditissima]|uniref:DNA primase n=1 Tax=Neonectria ditissima TaxID=78410 RepID=A0A0N8H4T0_9HYPO|nr:DNA primase small subunit [Neonectria ditissima]
MPSPSAVKDEPMEDTAPPEETAPAPAPAADVEMAVSEDTKKDIKRLEHLFDNVDSDDEFPSSAPVQASSQMVPGSPVDKTAMDASDPEVMRSFYQRLFPWRYLFQWLNHSPTPTNDFANREFALTLQNDAYLRYQSFSTADLLRKDVLRLMPSRFEIGPVYSANPRDRKTVKIKPLAKELCFDIDLTDYDDIRTCCTKANICIKCWQFMTMAIKVVDAALREDFGFKHIMWVYSGRRGAHAWVCDKKVRSMDDQKRRAIAGYLEVVKGGAQSGKKVNLWRPLHPHLSRSLDILKDHFQHDVLSEQDPWASSEQAEKLLQLLPDRVLNESLRKKWDAAPGRSSTSKWADIDAVAKTGASKNLDTKALREAKQDIVLEYTYPRLDIEVSKKLNHLLKSPFVVHPGTGRVCVPINTKHLDDFDPLGVPTVQGLLAEIDAWKDDDEDEAAKTISDWEKTSLKPYIDQFRLFVNGLMKDERDVKVKREREDDSMEF